MGTNSQLKFIWHSSGTVRAENGGFDFWNSGKCFRMSVDPTVGV